MGEQRAARGRSRGVLLAAAVALAGLAGCSNGSTAGPTTTSPPPSTTTAPELVWSAAITGEHDANGAYRQGLARSGDGWIFVTNNAIYRTDEDFQEIEARKPAIPDELAAQGYDHLGDPDIADGVIWIPVEKPDKDTGTQVTARYDEETLDYLDAVEVPQHHNAFVAVGADGTIWSTDLFTDDTLLRYRVAGGTAEVLAPLKMSRSIDRIQGGDLTDDAIYLSTDDDHNGAYRVDLETGNVTDLGTAGHIPGEGEGIDVTDLPAGLLHVLVGDENIAPMWVVAMDVTSAPKG